MRALRDRTNRVSYAECKGDPEEFLTDEDDDGQPSSEDSNERGSRADTRHQPRMRGRRAAAPPRKEADPQAGALRRFAKAGVDNTQLTAPQASRKKSDESQSDDDSEDEDGNEDEDFQRGRRTRGGRHKPVEAALRRNVPRRQAATKPAVVDIDEDHDDFSGSESDRAQPSGSQEEEEDGEEEEEEESSPPTPRASRKAKATAPLRRQPARAGRCTAAVVDATDEEEELPVPVQETRAERANRRRCEQAEGESQDRQEQRRRPPRTARAASPVRRQPARASRRTAEAIEPSEDDEDDEAVAVQETRTERANRRRAKEEEEEEEESGSEEEESEEEDGLLGEIQQILAIKGEGDEQRVLVKYRGLSHHENNWVIAKDVYEDRKQLIQNFLQKFGVTGEFEDENGFANGVNPDWMRVERVIGTRMRRGEKEYLVKWGSLPYSESTWEPEAWVVNANEGAIKQYRRYDNPRRAAIKLGNSKRRRAADSIPAFLNGRKLRDYQEISLKWNMSNWAQHRNCILGDEMGLGKTAQSISVLEAQRQAGHPGPFLVVAPLTTLGHWKREVETWTSMSCVLYSGTQADRKIIQDFEMKVPQSKGSNRKVLGTRFDVLLTSYENLRMDQAFLQKLWFQSAIVDEAHRLKSTSAQARRAIEAMDIGWLLLLTGTPIQNNLQELFGLMNLLDKDRYPTMDEFCARFGANGTPTPEQIEDLQECLKPILLRRMKEDVETLPEKEEVIIWVELTREQRMYYKALYGRDIGTLLGGTVGKNIPGLRNLAMELRKVCCHPYLCNGLEQDITNRETGQARSELENMVAASGKMMLLHKLLPKLKAEGHKVLIFSQFCIMLNVLEDYLKLCGHAIERIDGNTSGTERQAAIDRFCRGDTDSFVFLLSTKAGGQGITLTAADTVIIYDSDWNPQNDLQAMARCHRIGQEREVTIYRLLSRDTYEEAVFNASSRKYGLDEAVLGNMGPKGAAGDPEQDRKRIMDLLKNGAHSLGPSADQTAENHENAFAKEDIDQILSNRTEKRQIGSRAGNTFSVATFSAASEEPVAAGGSGSWEDILPEAVAAHAENLKAAKEATLAGAAGPRVRKRINYARQLQGLAREGSMSDSDEDEDEEGSGSGSGDADDFAGGRKRKKKKQGAAEAAKDKTPPVKPWLKREIKALVDALVQYGEGRTEQVRLTAELDEKRTLEQVKEVEAALLRLITKGPAKKENNPGDAATTAPSAPPVPLCERDAPVEAGDPAKAPLGAAESSEAAPVQPAIATNVLPERDGLPPAAAAVLTGPWFTRLFQRDCAAWADQLKQRRTLAELVVPAKSSGTPPAADPLQQAPPAKAKLFAPRLKTRPTKLPYWWNRLADSTLLAGCHKHGGGIRGVQAATAILTDPELGFSTAFAPSPEAEALDVPPAVVQQEGSSVPAAHFEGPSAPDPTENAPAATSQALPAVVCEEPATATTAAAEIADRTALSDASVTTVGPLAEVGAALEPAGSASLCPVPPPAPNPKDLQTAAGSTRVWLSSPDAEVVAQFGREMANKIKAVMSAEMPHIDLPEQKDPVAWSALITAVAARLKALLKAVATGEGVMAPPSQLLTRKRPAEGQEQARIIPSYAGTIGQDIRAMVLARMNSANNAARAAAATAAAFQAPTEIDDDFLPRSRPQPRPADLRPIPGAGSSAVINPAVPDARFFGPRAAPIQLSSGTSSVVDLISSDTSASQRGLWSRAPDALAGGSVTAGTSVTAGSSVINLAASDDEATSPAPKAPPVLPGLTQSSDRHMNLPVGPGAASSPAPAKSAAAPRQAQPGYMSFPGHKPDVVSAPSANKTSPPAATLHSKLAAPVASAPSMVYGFKGPEPEHVAAKTHPQAPFASAPEITPQASTGGQTCGSAAPLPTAQPSPSAGAAAKVPCACMHSSDVAPRSPLMVIDNCAMEDADLPHPAAVKAPPGCCPSDLQPGASMPGSSQQHPKESAAKKKKGSIASFFERQRLHQVQASAAAQQQLHQAP